MKRAGSNRSFIQPLPRRNNSFFLFRLRVVWTVETVKRKSRKEMKREPLRRFLSVQVREREREREREKIRRHMWKGTHIGAVAG